MIDHRVDGTAMEMQSVLYL